VIPIVEELPGKCVALDLDLSVVFGAVIPAGMDAEPSPARPHRRKYINVGQSIIDEPMERQAAGSFLLTPGQLPVWPEPHPDHRQHGNQGLPGENVLAL